MVFYFISRKRSEVNLLYFNYVSLYYHPPTFGKGKEKKDGHFHMTGAFGNDQKLEIQRLEFYVVGSFVFAETDLQEKIITSHDNGRSKTLKAKKKQDGHNTCVPINK